jgi:hypothetical protein
VGDIRIGSNSRASLVGQFRHCSFVDFWSASVVSRRSEGENVPRPGSSTATKKLSLDDLVRRLRPAPPYRLFRYHGYPTTIQVACRDTAASVACNAPVAASGARLRREKPMVQGPARNPKLPKELTHQITLLLVGWAITAHARRALRHSTTFATPACGWVRGWVALKAWGKI